MDELHKIFGEADALKTWHVVCRTIIILFFAFIFLRIAGRRSFGMHAPFDNLLAILMGAISSQGIVGTAGVFPVLAAGLTIALSHRLIAICEIYFPRFGVLLQGQRIPLFENGKLIKKNLVKSLVNEEDILREFRLRALSDDTDEVKAFYMETSGEISTVRKPHAQKKARSSSS